MISVFFLKSVLRDTSFHVMFRCKEQGPGIRPFLSFLHKSLRLGSLEITSYLSASSISSKETLRTQTFPTFGSTVHSFHSPDQLISPLLRYLYLE